VTETALMDDGVQDASDGRKTLRLNIQSNMTWVLPKSIFSLNLVPNSRYDVAMPLIHSLSDMEPIRESF
jgi:hypothetical protein